MPIFSDLVKKVFTVPTDTERSDVKSVTSSTTADTFGAYVEFIASTARISKQLLIYWNWIDVTTIGQVRLKIAKGAAGSEIDIAQFDQQLVTASEEKGATFPILLEIPSGTRISAAVTDQQTTSRTHKVSITIMG